MARYLKEGLSEQEKDDADARVRATVEQILDDIKQRGAAALRDYSEKFDNWTPDNFRLDQAAIDACYGQVTDQNIKDIEFAQAQVRNFAQVQKDALRDVEVETMPGVILGHKNIPVNSVGCLCAGRKVSDGRLGPYERGNRQGGRGGAYCRQRAALSRPAQPRHRRGPAYGRRR